jgi:dTDP-4-amino-4,6-dideoxygalactose transaminase
MLDLVASHRAIDRELHEAFDRVLSSGRFVLGEEVDAFEREIAELIGVGHAIGVSSGTDALLAALMDLDLQPGDEVLCPDFTFFATAGCVVRAGGVPVFIDVEESSFNSRREDFEPRITPRTRAIIVVHLFGRCCEMDEILRLAEEHSLPLIEDAAQAIGATTQDGGRAGAMGDVGCFSFFPTKNIGALGEGGLLTTDSAETDARLRSLRTHGESRRYHHARVGGNFRLHSLQAAFLRVKIPHVAAYTQARRRNAAAYEERLLASGLARRAEDGPADAPIVLPDSRLEGHVFHQFVLRLRRPGERERLREALSAQAIDCGVYYPVPLHRQECFADISPDAECPVSDRLAEEVLALPIHPDLDEAQIDRVATAIADCVGSSGA